MALSLNSNVKSQVKHISAWQMVSIKGYFCLSDRAVGGCLTKTVWNHWSIGYKGMLISQTKHRPIYTYSWFQTCNHKIWHLLCSQLRLAANLCSLECYCSADRKIMFNIPPELYIMSREDEKENKEQLLLFHIKVSEPGGGDSHFSLEGNVAIWRKHSMMCYWQLSEFPMEI